MTLVSLAPLSTCLASALKPVKEHSPGVISLQFQGRELVHMLKKDRLVSATQDLRVKVRLLVI